MSLPLPQEKKIVSAELPDNVFLRNAWQRKFAREGVPPPEENETKSKSTGSVNQSLLGKQKWKMKGLLPGGMDTWSAMSVLNKGLAPLTKSSECSSEFSKEALFNGFGKAFGKIFGGPAVKSDEIFSAVKGNRPWQNLVRETNPAKYLDVPDPVNPAQTIQKRVAKPGIFNASNSTLFSVPMRGAGGAIIGGQFDDPNDTKYSLDLGGALGRWGPGSLTGFAAGALSPAALRAVSNSAAPKDSIRKILSDHAIRQRLVTDPLTRVIGGSTFGGLVDSGASALGYDWGKEGYGRQVGIGLGLAGGLRPTAQLLAGRYNSINRLLTPSNTTMGQGFRGVQKGITGAQRGGLFNVGGWAMGSPYLTGSTVAVIGSGAADLAIGQPIQSLGEKRKVINEFLNDKNVQPALDYGREWFAQRHPGVPFMDRDGLPSQEALQVAKEKLTGATRGLTNVGRYVFADPNYLYNPDNWDRFNRADKILYDIVNGRYRQGEQFTANQLALLAQYLRSLDPQQATQ